MFDDDISDDNTLVVYRLLGFMKNRFNTSLSYKFSAASNLSLLIVIEVYNGINNGAYGFSDSRTGIEEKC